MRVHTGIEQGHVNSHVRPGDFFKQIGESPSENDLTWLPAIAPFTLANPGSPQSFREDQVVLNSLNRSG
jgi:hypothetical protein